MTCAFHLKDELYKKALLRDNILSDLAAYVIKKMTNIKEKAEKYKPIIQIVKQ